MQKKKHFVLWVLAFLGLSLFVNLVPTLFQQGNLSLWLAYWLSFFCAAFLVAKYVLKLQGLQSFGMRLHKGWFRNLSVGFLAGAGVYALKYLLCHSLGMFQVAGTMDTSFIAILLAQALLAMFFSSAINDVMIRGLWLPYFQREQLMRWYLPFATMLYILDDSWNEGIHIENLVFSALIGVTFAYTVLKTGNIWMSLGLHWGGNVLYRMMYGFEGQGVWRLENIKEGSLFDYVSLAATALLFPVMYIILKSRFFRVDKQVKTKEEGALPTKMA